MSRAPALASLVISLASAPALADEPSTDVEPAVVREEGVTLSAMAPVAGGSMRSQASSWLIMPDGWETSAELRFLTADAPPGGAPTKLTDVVVTHLGVRSSIKGKAEIAGGVDVLPKQPSYTDDLELQGGDLSLRYGVGRKHAVHTAVAGGPLSGGQGWWVGNGVGVQRRSVVHDTLSFQLHLGGSLTQLLFDDDRRAMLGEVVARAQTLFMAEDIFGLWLHADFAFPVAASGDVMPGVELDPTTRVDVGVGAVYSVVDDWDVYMELSVVDRGDAIAPETTLPVLQGGSDQRVFTFGVTRHFGGDDDDMYLAY